MYATAEDMRAEYGEDILVQLTDAPAWDAVAIARVNVKLETTAAEIDGYVAKYHQASAASAVPPLLRAINMTLAFAALHRVRTDDVKDREADARRQLRDISNGLLKLDEGRGDLPGRAGQVLVPEAERIFSRDRLRGF